MGRKITIEETDGTVEDSAEEYIPGRGESFAMGMVTGWNEVIKILPWLLIALILIVWLMC